MMGAWEKLAWTLVMPAFAECVASVWLQDGWFMLRTHDVKLIFLNATGALLEGLFSAWDGGRALPPRGTLGKVLLSVARGADARRLHRRVHLVGGHGRLCRLAGRVIHRLPDLS